MKKTSVSTYRILIILLLYISFENCTIFSALNRYVAMLIVVLTVLFILSGHIRLKNTFNTIHFIGLLIIIFAFINLLFSETTTRTGYFDLLLIATLIPLYIRWPENDLPFYFKWIERLVFVFTVSVYLNWIVKGLMTSYLSFLVVEGSKSVLVSELGAGQYSGLLAERSNAAVAAAIGIGIAFSKILTNSTKRRKHILEFLFYIFAIILTGKRAPIFFALLACVCVLLIKRYPNKGVKLPLILFGGVITGYLIFLYFPPVQNIIARTSLLIENDMLLNGRDVLWDIAFEMFHDRPLLGTGLNSFNTRFNLFGVWGSNWGSHAHNTFIQLLGEAGIIGEVLFIVFFVAILFTSIKTANNNTITESSKWNAYAIYSLYFQFFWIGYGFSGNPFYYLGQRVMYFMSVALILYLNQKIRNYKADSK